MSVVVILKKALRIPHSYTAVGFVLQGDQGLVSTALSAEAHHSQNPSKFLETWQDLPGAEMVYDWASCALVPPACGYQHTLRFDTVEILTSLETARRLMKGLHILEGFVTGTKLHEIAQEVSYEPQHVTDEVAAFYEKRNVGFIWCPP